MSKKFLAFILCVFSLSGVSVAKEIPAAIEVENQALLPILTPALSNQQILKLRLRNGLEAYLISDPDASKSAAALAVKVGSWEEPRSYPGLAHFLEHMLFLGTEKYPVESDYDRFIKEHNGQTNAYTANDHTLYFFSINNDAFEEALDRFSYFFKKPLFNPSGVSRELQAIDQEFAKNLNSDEFRQYSVEKELANPDHPIHQFDSGNSLTLSKVSQETLKKWYQEHYSAHLMRLIVYSPLPLATLKNLVIQDFGDIPTVDRLPFQLRIPALSNQEKGHVIYVESIKDNQSVEITWELPSHLINTRDSKPELLASHVLGHEGEGSLFAALKNRHLAEELYAYGQRLANANFLFTIGIELTVEGLQKVDQVIELCFAAIKQFQQAGIPPYLFDEVQKINKMRYQFQSRKDPYDAVMQLGAWLIEENLSTFPERTQIIHTFKPQLVQELLEVLKPQDAMIVIMAKPKQLDIKLDKKERWTGTSYAVRPFTQQELDLWSHPKKLIDWALPPPNPFIPQELKKVPQPTVSFQQREIPHPKTLIDQEGGKIYFAPDTIYGVPETSWFFEIKTPWIVKGDATQTVLADLYVKCLKETLNPFSYNAKMAGLDYELARGDNGINITLKGYSQTASLLLETMIKYLKRCLPTEQQFAIFKQSLLSQYENSAQDSPLEQGFETYRSILYHSFTTHQQAAEALHPITYDDFKHFLDHLFDEAYIEGLIYGTVQEDEIKRLGKFFKQELNSRPYPPAEQFENRVIVLPNRQPYFLNKTVSASGNAAILGIEDAGFSFKTRAAQQILSQAMSTPFYATLRTQQQTGYIVYNTAEEVEKHLFSFFAVQSNTHSPRDLLARFELFIEGFLQELGQGESLTQERFDLLKKSLLSTLEQPPQNQFEMGTVLKTLAFKYKADFDWVAKRIKGFQELTYEEFLEIAAQFLGKGNKRRLAILVEGSWTDNPTFQYKELQNAEQIHEESQYTGL